MNAALPNGIPSVICRDTNFIKSFLFLTYYGRNPLRWPLLISLFNLSDWFFTLSILFLIYICMFSAKSRNFLMDSSSSLCANAKRFFTIDTAYINLLKCCSTCSMRLVQRSYWRLSWSQETSVNVIEGKKQIGSNKDKFKYLFNKKSLIIFYRELEFKKRSLPYKRNNSETVFLF